MYKWTVLAICVCFTTSFVACNNSVEVNNQPIPVEQAVDVSSEASTNSVAVADTNAQSPASVADPIPPKDSSPVKVCEAFVRFLNSGEITNAELLLTPTALTVTSRADFQIPPVGDAKTTCTFGEPQFSTTKQQLCYVTCQLTDKETESEITWMLRKARRGWRIAGMMIDDETTGSVNLISFESPRDVQEIKAEINNDESVQD